MDILVLGCGVMGLSCGIRMLEAGHSVKIWARELPPNTTSNVAAAVWFPYKAYPQDLVNHWGLVAFNEFVELAKDPETGVVMLAGKEIFEEQVGDPEWRTQLPNYRRASGDDLPEGYVDGYVYDVPVIETPRYMFYLLDRFKRLGGTVEERELQSIDEALAESSVVVNCTGLGSRELLGDKELYPIRGQIVRVIGPKLDAFYLDDYGHRGLAYIIPRQDGIILGGTSDEGAEEKLIDPATAEAIIERCTAIEPSLKGSQVVEHKVGLRPGRTSVRLEAESLANGALVIHNYGHGGAGVTLSWGCAEAVMGLLPSA
jgi:D-amino-acid oxidase